MAQHLLFKLLEPNPSWRYNAAQALKHPWITRNKNDEVPLTFNEILHKSNMKKVGKELFGAMLFINYFTKKKKFLINNEYIQTCKFYDKKAKNKNIKRKEKCLDILSADEGDDSEPELPNEKKCFIKKNLIEKKSDFVNSIQNSFIISANNIIHKIIKKKKMNFPQSMKNVKKLNRINQTDKKIPFNFKKMDYQLNLFSNRKRADSLKKNNNENYSNSLRTHLIKICIKSQNEKSNEIIKRNNYKSIQCENNKELKYSKSLKIINDSKKPIINNYYEERLKNKKRLPDINSQMKKNDISSKQYSLNDSENFNIIPLVLPNIKLLKKANNLRKNIKKVVIGNRDNKIKNS